MTDEEKIAHLTKTIEDALDWLSGVSVGDTSNEARAKETLQYGLRTTEAKPEKT